MKEDGRLIQSSQHTALFKVSHWKSKIREMAKSIKPKQLDMLPKGAQAYGGFLRNTRKGRLGARSLTTKGTIHLVLRSSRAKGAFSFQRNKNLIDRVLREHANKCYIKLISVANVGNHIHLHIKLTDRELYKKFIRSVTGIIALKIKRLKNFNSEAGGQNFWDYRPFTRVVMSFRHYIGVKDYVLVNAFEGLGMKRIVAQMIVRQNRSNFLRQTHNSSRYAHFTSG